MVDDLTWVVLEQALRERFIEFYGGVIPLVGKNGAGSMLPASDFEAVSKAFRQGRSHTKGWELQLPTQGTSMRLPLTLRPLLRWARQERLLHGQRNRRVEEDLFDRVRNRFAHGGGFRIGMPNQSARRICDLAEIINRLWGETTPGGAFVPRATSSGSACCRMVTDLVDAGTEVISGGHACRATRWADRA